MTTAQRVWISKRAYDRLQSELAALRGTRPGREEADDRQLRIHQIRDLLTDVTVGQDPPDDGIAEPGMVLTVRFDDTDAVETFLLGVRSAEHGDLEVYSNQAPLGAALEGALPGERRTYRLPNGTAVTVTLLNAVPYGMHTEGRTTR